MKKKNYWFSYFQSTHRYQKWPVKYYFWWLRYMIVRINNRVQLSIYSTSALFHKYCVVIMKYRWICKFLILSECPSLSETLSALLELIVYFVLPCVIAILYFHSSCNTYLTLNLFYCLKVHTSTLHLHVIVDWQCMWDSHWRLFSWINMPIVV